MATLLHIQSSPRKLNSVSYEVAQAFIIEYQKLSPHTQLSTFDLWNSALPELDQHALEAKYAGLQNLSLTPEQSVAWERIKTLVNMLHRTNLLVLSTPLWNFGIPYKLKQLIDLITHKDLLFSFDTTGFKGLLHNKKAVMIYARGLDFSNQSDTPAEQFDFQKPYMELWLKFIGITDVHSIIAEKTISTNQPDSIGRLDACNKARELATELIYS